MGESAPTAQLASLPKPPAAYVCSKCGDDLDEQRCRQCVKGGGRYICKRCGVKDVQIAQMGGRETLNSLFKDLSEAEQKAFWQRAGQTKDSKALKEMVDTMVESKHSEGTVVVEGGTYQPLSWFRKNGYNTKKVKMHCRKTMKHAV